jgi:hypothetical protein
VPPNSDIPEPPSREDDVDLLVARQMSFDQVPDPSLTEDEYLEVVRAMAAIEEPSVAANARVLSSFGMDSDDWMLEERGWRERVGQALEAGDMPAVEAFTDRLKAARRLLPDPKPAVETDMGGEKANTLMQESNT